MAKNKKILLVSGAVICAVAIVFVCFLALGNKEKATYTVSFNSNGGTVISNQIVSSGEKIKRPTDPTKEGYIFVEWLLNGKLFDFNTPIEKDINLVAKWQENSSEVELITIKFDSNGGTTISNEIIEKGKKATKPKDPVKEGYTFVGWQLSDAEYNFDNEVVEDIELIAKWEKNVTNTNTTTPTVKKYTVTFNSNGGSNIASQQVTEGGKASNPGNPTKNGYTFTGWTLNGTNYNFNSAVNGNITLVAVWTENARANYTVTFDSNGGSAVSSQTVVEGNKATKPSDPSKTAHKFNGWTLNDRAYDFNSAVNGNITLKASWMQNTYTIKISYLTDSYSPARKLTVFENGNIITVDKINYTDGIALCSGANPVASKSDVKGESSFKIVFNDGTSVIASVVESVD